MGVKCVRCLRWRLFAISFLLSPFEARFPLFTLLVALVAVVALVWTVVDDACDEFFELEFEVSPGLSNPNLSTLPKLCTISEPFVGAFKVF